MLIHDCQVIDKENQGPYSIGCLCARACARVHGSVKALFSLAQVLPRTGVWNASP